MQSLKPTTRQLIESFRYRRLAYLGRDSSLRWGLAVSLGLDRLHLGRKEARDKQLRLRDYRLAMWADLEASRHKASDLQATLDSIPQTNKHF